MKKAIKLSLTLIFSLNAKVQIIEKGYSYDDVLLVPQKSILSSRSEVNTRTKLTKNIDINIPIIGANMDTVTESNMAIALAKMGGIGIIHRFNTIEQQVDEVKRVKRYRNSIITNPITISEHSNLFHAYNLMQNHQISGLLVVDSSNKLAGIITRKDIPFNDNYNKLVKDCMTPRERLIVGRHNISINEAKEILYNNRLEKLPLVNANNTIAGLITKKDINSKIEFSNASLDTKGQLMVGAAIGVKDDALKRAEALIYVGVDVLVIDIAHGHSDLELKTLKTLKEKFPNIDVIAGNVATAQATKELIEAGADAIKVGIGPGSICTTRIVSGCGYPQLSAIISCSKEAEKYGIPVIADGGIKYSGDIVKAIAAGASTVMLGNLLAGTDESPGVPFVKNGKKFKVIRGMASFGANLGRKDKEKSENSEVYVPEGVEAVIPYKGNVKETLIQLLGGLRSGMSYCGVTNLQDLVGNGTFVEITSAGVKESHSHDVQQVVN